MYGSNILEWIECAICIAKHASNTHTHFKSEFSTVANSMHFISFAIEKVGAESLMKRQPRYLYNAHFFFQSLHEMEKCVWNFKICSVKWCDFLSLASPYRTSNSFDLCVAINFLWAVSRENGVIKISLKCNQWASSIGILKRNGKETKIDCN